MLRALIAALLALLPVLAAAQEALTYPVLRPRGMFAPDVLAALPHKDFPGDLVEAWVVDAAGYLSYLDDETLAAGGQALPVVEARALEALREKARGLAWQKLDTVQALVLDGVYESSVLLLPEVWQALDRTMGQVVVAVPTRDVVLLADGDDPAQVAALRRIVGQVEGQYPNPVTDRLFAWDGTGWTVLPR